SDVCSSDLFFTSLVLTAYSHPAPLTGFHEMDPSKEVAEGWKAAVARIDITPKVDMWMAGYGSRTSPSEGTLHPIWVKALALEDATGKRSVLITSDLLGWPKAMSDNIRQQVEEKYGLTKAQIILNSSHTHTGPVLGDALFDIYPAGPEERRKIEAYTADLTIRVVNLVGESLVDL